jgi:hypothetical protein
VCVAAFALQVSELLPQYKRQFDVVIYRDGPMDYVNDLLESIISASQ